MTTPTPEELVELAERESKVPRCSDFDEDCDDLDHVHCYLYDPAKGYCPFLRASQENSRG